MDPPQFDRRMISHTLFTAEFTLCCDPCFFGGTAGGLPTAGIGSGLADFPAGRGMLNGWLDGVFTRHRNKHGCFRQELGKFLLRGFTSWEAFDVYVVQWSLAGSF